jgi:ABC-type Fe3+/spermidine/putrescine transport system ATPase subunit
MTTQITLDQVSKHYGDHLALHPLTLEIAPGEMVTVVGPSGCGKSTLLRLLAGFLTPDTGRILFNGQPVEHLLPERRPTSLVFQNYALWPHKTVAEHIAFGLRVQGWTAHTIAARVKEMLTLVGLEGLEQRYPGQLSGGQQQRVALARSLAVAPGILLLDEPLSNLDAQIRVQMRSELRALQQRVGLTTMYVTHDQEEALSVADRVIVLRSGVLEQYAPPETVYHRPASPFVARFIGRSNLLSGCVQAIEAQIIRVQLDAGAGVSGCLTVPRTNWLARNPPLEHQQVILAIKPEHIQLASAATPPGVLTVDGHLVNRSFLGAEQHLDIRTGNTTLLARRIAADQNGSPAIGSNNEVRFWVAPDQVLLFAESCR